MTSIDLLLTLVLAGGGAYFGAYLKQKGKNLATQEDIDKLVGQVAAVTKTTKEIEAKISSEVWDRQKLWELKRNVLFELAKRVAAICDALGSLSNAYEIARKDHLASYIEVKNEMNQKWFAALTALEESKLFVDVICGNDLQDTVHTFKHRAVNIAYAISKDDPEIFLKSHPELRKLRDDVVEATRKELGVAR